MGHMVEMDLWQHSRRRGWVAKGGGRFFFFYGTGKSVYDISIRVSASLGTKVHASLRGVFV